MPQQAAPATNSSAPSARSRSTPAARLDDRSYSHEREQEPRHPPSADPLTQNRPGDEHRKDRRQARDDDRAVRSWCELEAVQEERVVPGDRGRAEGKHERQIAPLWPNDSATPSRPDRQQKRGQREARSGNRERRDVFHRQLSGGPGAAEANGHREEEQIRGPSVAHAPANEPARPSMPQPAMPRDQVPGHGPSGRSRVRAVSESNV